MQVASHLKLQRIYIIKIVMSKTKQANVYIIDMLNDFT